MSQTKVLNPLLTNWLVKFWVTEKLEATFIYNFFQLFKCLYSLFTLEVILKLICSKVHNLQKKTIKCGLLDKAENFRL